jgi:uncharacterized membrane protein
MDYSTSEWINLVFRWAHVLAGIAWIGQTFLFNWFERHLADEPLPEGSDPNIAGRLWMVHGGGFYQVEKQKTAKKLPNTLHWFKWESMITVSTGYILLVVVYYLGGAMVDNMVMSAREWKALMPAWLPLSGESGPVIYSLSLIVIGWLVYDLLVSKTPVGTNDWLAAAVFFPLIVALTYLLSHTLSGRATFIQVGAMFGTIMVSNVWLKILPGQRRMLAAIEAGKTPDMSHGSRGKQRSKHNTFMAVPLVFLMLSNHFPTAAYGHGASQNWLWLCGFILVGWVVAKFIREH